MIQLKRKDQRMNDKNRGSKCSKARKECLVDEEQNLRSVLCEDDGSRPFLSIMHRATASTHENQKKNIQFNRKSNACDDAVLWDCSAGFVSVWLYFIYSSSIQNAPKMLLIKATTKVYYCYFGSSTIG